MILPEGVPVLETENLILRGLSFADLPELFAMRKDPRMHAFTDTKPDQTIEETKAYIEKMRKGADERLWLIWGIAHQRSNRLIGSISLWNLNALQDTAELGYGITPDHQGRGYMKEALLRVVEYAFRVLRLKALETYSEENNAPSIRLLEACRFKAAKRVDDVSGDGNRIFHMVVYRLENTSQ